MPSTNLSPASYGIAENQTGMIIQDYSYSYSAEKTEVLGKDGVIGLVYSDPKIDITLNALVPTATPFAGQIGSVIVLGNALPAHIAGTGSIFIDEITRDAEIRGLQKISVKATMYAGLTA